MADYEKFKLLECKRSPVGDGSVEIFVARRLPHDLAAVSVLLVDLWKLGLKDGWGHERITLQEFNDFRDSIMEAFAKDGIEIADADITDVKWVVAQGIRLAEAVGTPKVDRKWVDMVGDLSAIKLGGSLYKCYNCGRGELSEEDCAEALEVAKEELRTGVAGTPEESAVYFECKRCESGGQERAMDRKADIQTDTAILPVREGVSEKSMNKALDAIALYLNFFIPLHPDGKTAADADGITPPKWLADLIALHKEGRLSEEEREIDSRGPTDFSNYLISQVMKDLFEGGAKTKRAEVVKLLMAALDDEDKRAQYMEASRHGSKAAVRRPTSDNKALKIVVPFVTAYAVDKPSEVERKLSWYKKNGDAAVKFYGKYEKVYVPDNDDPWVSAFVETSGTKLGTLKLEGDTLLLSSMAEARNRALCEFAEKLFGDVIHRITTFKDVESKLEGSDPP